MAEGELARAIEYLRTKYGQRETNGFDRLDFLSAFGSPVDAIMYLGLFWPECVCYKDMVFRADALEDDEDRADVDEALERLGGNKTEVEKRFSILDMPCGVFSRDLGENDDALDQYLVGQIAQMWNFRLHSLFPDREFAVEIVKPEDNNQEYGVWFYTVRR
ncbi:MAG: hypothetical protein AAF772_03070 [Acidobacteriota bacterium]